MRRGRFKNSLLQGAKVVSAALMLSVWDFLIANWRDVLNILAFVITIGTLLSTRNAAIAARDAAQNATEKAQRNYARSLAISTLTAVRGKINRIYELQSAGSWDAVPPFYKDVREELSQLRGKSSALTEEERGHVQSAIVDFKRIEEQIQIQLSSPQPKHNLIQINATVTTHSEMFTTIEIELRSEQG